METIKNIIEYYDELFPVTESQKKFYEEESSCYEKPVKYLRIGCGTGMLENYLAQEGSDVTGIEPFKELLDCANRRRRTQLMSVRFFQMTTLEMNRFLGKKFYDIVSCLDDRIEMISDPVLLRKFFFDVKELLAKDGKLILKLINFSYFSKPVEQLPEISNIRVSLKTKITTDDNSTKFLSQEIKTGNGHILPVLQNIPVFPLQKKDIQKIGKEAGFKNIEFYENYSKEPFSDTSENMIAVLS